MRVKTVRELNEAGIAARRGFQPMSLQTEYMGHHQHLNAYRCSQHVMYLPIDPGMTKEDVRQILDLM